MKNSLFTVLGIFIFNFFLIKTANAQSVSPEIDKYNLAIKKTPNNDEAWYKRGMAYYKLGKYDLAISDFTQSLKINADNTNAQGSRAAAYLKQLKYDLALADYTAVLDADPEDKYALLSRGDLYRTLHQYKPAIADYKEAVSVDSTRDSVWSGLGLAYYKLGKYDSAVYGLTKALTLRPNFPAHVVHIMLALSASEAYGQAAVYYNTYKAKKLNGYIELPEFAFLKPYLNACTGALTTGDYKASLPLLQQAAAMYKPTLPVNENSDSTEYANISAKLGLVYEKLDKADTALTYYLSAQAVNAGIPGINDKIAKLQFSLRKNTVPPLIKLTSPTNQNTSRGILVDDDSAAAKKRITNIEITPSTDHLLVVKGFAQAPSGISQVKINGIPVNVTIADTIAYFETTLSDTIPLLNIQAWNKKNSLTDTTFRLVMPRQSLEAANFVIPPLADKETFHAILIACSDYTGPKWPQLVTTISDANSVKKELIDEYNFAPENVDTIYNKERKDILDGLYKKLESLGENDNILIFFAGHGTLDPQSNVAYWVPVNANTKSEYISNDDIRAALNNSRAKHVLLLADACYSGAMRGAADDYVRNKNEFRVQSRQILTSGSAEAVPGVSVFIPTILEELKLNNEPIYSAQTLYIDIAKTVLTQSGKTPIFKPLEGIKGSISYGQFYFRKNVIDSNRVKTPEEIADEKRKVEIAKQEYLRKKDVRDSLIVQGKIKKDKELFDQAVLDFAKAKEINPDQNNTYAKNLYDEAYKLASLTPDQHYKMCIDSANAYALKRDHQSEYKWYQKAVAAKPDQKAEVSAKMNALIDKIGFFERIDALVKAGDYKTAISEYKKAIKREPNDVEYYMGRARCYEAMGQSYYSDALDDLTKAITLEPTYPASRKARAELQVKNGKKWEAITDYKVYISQEESAPAYMELYKLHNDPQVNAKDDAITDLSSAISQNPGYTEAYYKRGLLYFDYKKDYQKAFADFNTTVQQDPSSAVNYFQRGSSYFLLSKLDEAGADFKTAREKGLEASYVAVIESYGELLNENVLKYAADKDYQMALSTVNMAITINPLSPAYRFEKGDYYFEKKMFNDAIVSYDTAVMLNPAVRDALYKRGTAYYNLGKFHNAIQNYDTIIKINAADLYAVKGKADSYFALKDYTNAQPAYETALKIIDDGKSSAVPDTVKSHINNNLGYSYYQNGAYDQSIQSLKRAVKVDENYALAYYNIGKSYEKNNALDDAAEKVDKALSYETNHADWYFSGAEIYKNKSNFGKAAEYYTKAIENDTLQLFKVAYYFRGYCYKQSSNFADAATDYTKALRFNLDTGFQQFNNELGSIYYNLDNYDSAYLFYNKSYIADSSEANAPGAFGLASVLFQQKKLDNAIVLFEKALKTKVLNKNYIKADKNFALFKNEKRFNDIYKKYY